MKNLMPFNILLANYVIKVVLEKVDKSKKDATLKEELIICLSNLKEREEKRVSTCCGYNL